MIRPYFWQNAFKLNTWALEVRVPGLLLHFNLFCKSEKGMWVSPSEFWWPLLGTDSANQLRPSRHISPSRKKRLICSSQKNICNKNSYCKISSEHKWIQVLSHWDQTSGHSLYESKVIKFNLSGGKVLNVTPETVQLYSKNFRSLCTSSYN